MMKHTLLLLFTLFCLGFSLSSCEKDPEIITETIIERDTIIISSVDTIFIPVTDTLTLTDTLKLTSYINDTATTFILARHAETTLTVNNPVLSAAGQARAQALRRMLGNVPLSAVYSTDYNRTRMTATPTANEKSLPLTIYNPSALSSFADNVLATQHAKTVLVIGHSNTTPSLLNILAGTSFPDILDTEHDDLFIVTVFEKGRADVLHLKYGE